MNNMGKVEKIVQSAPNGIITAAQLTKAGLHRGYLHDFVESGELYRFGRGLYVQSSTWEDDFYLLQRKYSRGIYSHDTALYLLGYSDRTPARYTMTFPKGYNALSLKQEELIVKRVIPENYDFGIIEIQSPSGNPIPSLKMERMASWVSVKPLMVVSKSIVARVSRPTIADTRKPPLIMKLCLYGESEMRSSSLSSI